MSAPGWYNAQGDPPGTQRYWDGGQWIGEPVYEPSATPQSGGYSYAPPAPAGSDQAWGLLRPLALAVSIIKAIPLALGLIVALILGAFANGLDNEFGQDDEVFSELLGAAAVIIVVMILLAGALLVFQFVGAIKRQPMMVFVPALIMSLFDLIGVASSWAAALGSNGSAGWAVVMTLVGGAQITVAVLAFRARQA